MLGGIGTLFLINGAFVPLVLLTGTLIDKVYYSMLLFSAFICMIELIYKYNKWSHLLH